MFDQLEIPPKFFQNLIVLRMLGIRNCVPLRWYAINVMDFKIRYHCSYLLPYIAPRITPKRK